MIKKYICENCGNIVSEYGDPYLIDIPPWCGKCDSENGMKLIKGDYNGI